MSFFDRPGGALLAGLAVTAAILIVWITAVGVDRLGLVSFLLRWTHAFAGMVWVGLIWFVNFIQLRAVAETDDAGRAALMRHVVPRVATTFGHFSHLNLLTGIALLFTAGYLLDVSMFGTAVYIPPLRNLFLWGGTLGGLAMWAIVHFAISPALAVVLDASADAAAKAAARDRVRIFARLNLILAVPVTFVMVAASHLY